MQGCKLFVYGVATQTPKEDLQSEFERFGNVSDAYNSGKGYAFITYETKEEAEQAKQMMNGTTVCGQEIKVSVVWEIATAGHDVNIAYSEPS